MSARTKSASTACWRCWRCAVRSAGLRSQPQQGRQRRGHRGAHGRQAWSVASVLVQEGTLRVGDTLVVGDEMGKVRALMDDKGRQLQSAGPSTPVEILGLSGVPRAGEGSTSSPTSAHPRSWSSSAATSAWRKSELAGPVSLDKLLGCDEGGPQRAQGHPQGRRAGLGRGAVERPGQAHHAPGQGHRHPVGRRRHHRDRREPGQGRQRHHHRLPRPPGRQSVGAGRKASISNCTTSSTTPWTT